MSLRRKFGDTEQCVEKWYFVLKQKTRRKVLYVLKSPEHIEVVNRSLEFAPAPLHYDAKQTTVYINIELPLIKLFYLQNLPFCFLLSTLFQLSHWYYVHHIRFHSNNVSKLILSKKFDFFMQLINENQNQTNKCRKNVLLMIENKWIFQRKN